MKKMLFSAALAMLITGCAQQTFTVGNKPTAVTPKETITHHFFVSGIGQEKTVDAAKICGGAENVVKTETQQTFVNGLLGFITFGIYTPLEARVYSLQLFLHSDKPLSEGGNNPVQRCLPVGGAALSTPEAVVASRGDGQIDLICNRRRPAATSSRRASFSDLGHLLISRLTFAVTRL